eukprot:CAMPEP_0167744484 /NCGR_PEP_ID=MMETSP0110_2-20121227/2618_1 /TAXON_ID=629695 /ORGANISM="Gymnochlora sp., Strain CCMP2014" /LENGTH=329 /DNA_ID=CAMNT_0007629013 /DNA_START=107 /DNA_END=1096 /DNA_ORIENTATION=-
MQKPLGSCKRDMCSTIVEEGKESKLEAEDVPMPTSKQLRIHFIHCAVPMVGFGFMDNMVMLTAGDLIDNTIGVKFGLATLTAAAFGQICSDVSGIAFGGIVEDLTTRLGLPVPNLLPKQRRLPKVKFTGNLGMICGVVIGCILGMVSLLFLDTGAAERAKHEKEVETIFNLVLDHGHKVIHCDRASLFIFDKEENVLWSKIATGAEEEKIVVPIDTGLIGLCFRTGKPLIVNKPYAHPEFHKDVDQKLGYKTRTVLCYPIYAEEPDNIDEINEKNQKPHFQNNKAEPEVLGVVQMLNKENDKVFCVDDLKITEMLAYHVSMFLKNKKMY